MQNVRTHVVIEKGLLKEIDSLFGKRKRSSFVTEALRRAIQSERLRAALSQVKVVEGKKEQVMRKAIDAEVRKLRQEWK